MIGLGSDNDCKITPPTFSVCSITDFLIDFDSDLQRMKRSVVLMPLDRCDFDANLPGGTECG